MGSSVPRRALLVCACALVAGCESRPATSPSAGPSPATSAQPSRSAAPVSIAVDEVPVGGGILVDVGEGIVVTRPTATTVKAYSAVCTHEGCTINDVQDGEMVCPCHGSRFQISDGAVTRGPAKRRLDPVAITVVDGHIRFA
jgi:nitrite reductase/ring-hydroxylating ferredoxin subunit